MGSVVALGDGWNELAAQRHAHGSHFSVVSDLEAGSGNSHRLGLAAATGVEHMVSPNWVLRGQVEYAQFQTQRITSDDRNRFGQETSVLTGTLGLSYKFGPR